MEGGLGTPGVWAAAGDVLPRSNRQDICEVERAASVQRLNLCSCSIAFVAVGLLGTLNVVPVELL